MTRKRSVGEQVVSGFRISGLILLSIGVFLGLWVGFTHVLGKTESASSHPVIGAISVAILAIFLFATARYWTRWFFAFLVFAAVRMLPAALLGPYFRHPVDRVTAFLWVIYAATAAALTMRYFRRKPRQVESFGLVVFVLCIAMAGASENYFPLIAGIIVLGLCELIQLAISKSRHVRSASITGITAH
jgi:hypothetical protein